ncbi:ubiquitin carboxyl-terminal hydrolase 24-like [Mytilus trossulus]|uniref:ubiquitin carboxyl-terminal hydrolase 24-like n=1 Tax=Mytilus trossulus TaxID=6551 RepID=UPI003006CC20
MEIDEEHVSTLLAMGFPSENECRKALRLANNDLNEAVAFLTNDHPTSSYDTLDDIDVEMKELSRTSQPVYGPAPPPSYEEVIPSTERDSAVENGNGSEMVEEGGNPLEFPVTNLYELEGRVFAEHWSIPYKKEESLGKCLLAATRLAEANLTENDENCKRFIERCMPESFRKLTNSPAVHRWNTEIQEGIFNMLQLLVDLVATRIQHLPVPKILMEVFYLALNKDSEFHYKNRQKRDRTYWEDKIEDGVLYTCNTSYKSTVDPYGWLTHLINRFACKNGVEHVRSKLEDDDLDAISMSALLSPLGVCAEFLNPKVVQEVLAPAMEKCIKFVQNLDEKDFKQKNIGCVSELLGSMKLLCIQMWPQHTDSLDDLRLEIAFKMLKSPHFNAKMNSLKEVAKLIEDATSAKSSKTAMNSAKILQWLVENKILSIALEGNIDQAQYCDKIKGLVDFLGSELSTEELNMIWKMQIGQTNNVIDNMHTIIAAAAVKFDSVQLESLFLLIQKKWQEESDRMREKLLSLIGRIGRDGREPKTTTRVLELLWDLSHLPALSTHLIELALEEHLAILSDSFSVREQVKRQYVIKCVEDIKKGVCVLHSLKQLLHICKNILKLSSQKTDKGILHDLNKNHDVIKLVTQSLVKCHKQASGAVGDGQLGPDTIVNRLYAHSEMVSTHLLFLQYMLQEGALYLPWSRARDIWGTLIASPEACEWDRETCFEWFTKGLPDLEMDTQSQLFQKELLKLDPVKLSEKGFTCFKSFLENVNKYEHRLKPEGNKLIVEKTELLGLDYLWDICLNTSDENIANISIQLLMTVSYTNLAPRLKKDAVSLHKKFITECYNRLENAMIGIGGTVLARCISSATKTLTAPVVQLVSTIPLPCRSIKLQNIERLLWIAEVYVLNVEEAHNTPRTILPHGAAFQGYQINLYVTCESSKQDFMLVCHSNETLCSVRTKVSNRMKKASETIQIIVNEKMLETKKDQKLLNQLDFEDNQTVMVKLTTPVSVQSSQVPTTPTSKLNFDLEQEKTLPGVVMAVGGQVFEMLYQLANLDEARITSRVRKLLMLIPTDQGISDVLDSISQKGMKQFGSGEDLSPKTSPRKTTPIPSPKLPPKDILKSLFDSESHDMSAFRVLYNLEVLSSKLMPVTQDIGSKFGAQSFCEDFLNAGGLQLVVNVLQPESLAPDINYTIRQGCYSICLQLARFLLCGQTVTGDGLGSISSLDDVKAGAISVPATPTSLTQPLTIIVEKPSAGSHAVQTMGVYEFTETVSCFMRVTWAAAAGRLHLLGSSQPIIESTTGLYTCGKSRQSSTGSTGSTNSDSDCQSLHAGVCIRQQIISSQDCTIAKEALEILVTCLQLRCELIASFYTLPCISDFIIDILVGCSQSDIRTAALEQFFILSQTTLSSDSVQQTPHQFMLKVLLKAYLPFWVSSTQTRGASQRLILQCSQYFDLRCKLLENLSMPDQTKLNLDLPNMLEDEIAWLKNFETSSNPDLIDADNLLLGGHLKLIRNLFTCEGICKEEFGRTLVYDLLHDFLFPASKIMMDSMDEAKRETALAEVSPKCRNSESRIAAYDLLIELSRESVSILKDLCRQLVDMHHQPHPEVANEWEYLPPVDGRARCGYVGLRNGGATCYMNAVIQQLYMTPGVPESVLGVVEDTPDEDSVFYQLQQVFGQLLESKLQYFEPEKFWKVFKLWGQVVNIREQQDAFDFFTALMDQADEYTKTIGKYEIFKKNFQGIFSDQKICKDCPHRYEREEEFFALNLTVKNATLQDSLDQFVKGEILEGDNAYYCEKCQAKRNTMKRMCIKTLPPLLCIQLKRFGYDWEANRALKFDDYFKFPWILDMEPYTTDGMARREEAVETSSESSDSGETNPTEDKLPDIVIGVSPEPKQINYELVGIVVHSGQANAGHYYSFIKERRGNSMTNPNKGKWFKFNDTYVEEFEMNDASVESECFGGTYKTKNNESSSTNYPDERVRYWNGYMLFYEKMAEVKTPGSAKKTRITAKRPVPDLGKGRMDSDSLMELTELVHKGERRGIFMDDMPARIHQNIQAENLTFVKNRDVYNTEYFKFVRDLAAKNCQQIDRKDYSTMCVEGLQLGVKFVFNTYFRSKLKTRVDLDEWLEVFDTLIHKCKEACMWLVQYLSTEEGFAYIKPFLLECPNSDVRRTIAAILQDMMSNFFSHGGSQANKNFNEILEHLLQMLNKDVIDHCKNCNQYFNVLRCYVELGTKACTHMFLRQGFQRLIFFLLGQPSSEQNQESSSRRWSSIQSREFGNLHATIALLVLNCDLSVKDTCEPGDFPVRKPTTVSPSKVLRLSPDMEQYVFGPESNRYIREVVHAVREVTGNHNYNCIADMLIQCSFCNADFSRLVLKYVMHQYSTAPSNELKPIFTLLEDLLTLEDPIQTDRLQIVVDGYIDEAGTEYEGLLAVVRSNHMNDSRRSYSCIKFLVSVANKCNPLKEYLIQIPSKWQWSVNWLKKKMSEYWSPAITSTVSNEDSNRKSFQRTISAQSTLEEAKALLTEIESQEGFQSDMDTNGNRAEVDTEKETVTYTSSDTHMSTVEEQKEPKGGN